ncbi:unnamed protein product [Lactuca saligna]|uniref:glycerophosphodiester phosphodiesterase n=1 Tax=Lactuca saligna TaxID=75948 RepID=A0AA35V450_LACSI|nr:unnamed protein product [Lactuca saligna]
MLCFVVKQTTEALAEQVTQEHFDNGLIYPTFTNIRKISAHIAARVAAKAYELVPKSYIWPVDNDFYLQPSTSLILDAHKEDLQVFCSDFMNDVQLAYNYSYDHVEDYLYVVDNGRFSMDGVLFDNPVTPSVAFMTVRFIQKDPDEKKSSFNPRLYFKLFIDWLVELSTLDPIFEGANFQEDETADVNGVAGGTSSGNGNVATICAFICCSS